MQRTQSLDCLYSEPDTPNRRNRLNRSSSLDNIHLNANLSWFASHKLVKSKSLDNHVNLVDKKSTKPQKFRMNSNLIHNELVDDQNLPASISEDLFGELMRFEKNRLRTFKNWPVEHVTPADLSRAGFYYLLNSDLVRCFECKITLFNWEPGDVAIIEHYKNNAKCRLINGYNVRNQPIDEERTPHILLRENVDFNEFRPVEPTENVIASFDDLEDDDEDLRVLNEHAIRFDRQRLVLSTAENKPANSEDVLRENEEKFFETMKSEERRLKTFENWPQHLKDKVRPADLAQCGFFFTTIKDRVICAFCRTPAWSWEPTDVPVKEHYRHCADCPLLNDRECGNIPIKEVKFRELLLEYQDVPPSVSNSYPEDDVSFLQLRSNNSNRSDQQPSRPTSNQESFEHSNETNDLNEFSQSKLEDLSIVVSKHKHVEKYYTFQNRLDTFSEWPNKNVSKNKLADAGFYYLGIKDQVQCISCNLVLSDWLADEDPWIEHCKYHSDCEFLKLNKGTSFVTRNSKLKNSPKNSVNCTGSTASSASSNSSSDIENENSPNCEEDEKTACKVCMVKKADIVYLPCLHLASCASCTIAMKDCPLCKSQINSTMKIYIG